MMPGVDIVLSLNYFDVNFRVFLHSIRRWINVPGRASCPICRIALMNRISLRQAPKLVRRMLEDTHVKCAFSSSETVSGKRCSWSGERTNLKKHYDESYVWAVLPNALSSLRRGR